MPDLPKPLMCSLSCFSLTDAHSSFSFESNGCPGVSVVLSNKMSMTPTVPLIRMCTMSIMKGIIKNREEASTLTITGKNKNKGSLK